MDKHGEPEFYRNLARETSPLTQRNGVTQIMLKNPATEKRVNESIHDFLCKGYCKVNLTELPKLKQVRGLIEEALISVSDIKPGIAEGKSLENIHQHLPEGNINNIRLKVIKQLNDIGSFNKDLYLEPLPTIIKELIGPDVLIQKHANLVIQRPLDLDYSELHRDSPANSEFEIVIWIPFVDCSPDMSLYIIDKDETTKALSLLKRSRGKKWSLIKRRFELESNPVQTNFGEALMFMAPLYHGSLIHTNSSTRISTNYRVRGLFSPSGKKDSLNFWEICRISTFTKNACDFL